MIMTKIIMPRGSNHSTLNEGDLVVMYCIQNVVVVDCTYTICDHMMCNVLAGNYLFKIKERK